MTSYTWDDFPLHTEVPTVEEILPRERVVRIGGHRYLELPDNGYQLLLAWLAGPERVCRIVDRTSHTVTTTIRSQPGRHARVSTELRTDEDQALIDSMVNSRLHDAGAPPRPRGFTWYLKLPESLHPADVWAAIRVDAGHGNPVDSDTIKTAMVRALQALYPPTG